MKTHSSQLLVQLIGGKSKTVTHFTLAEGKTYSEISLAATCKLSTSYSSQWYQFTTSETEKGGSNAKGTWEVTRTYTDTSKTSFASKCRNVNNNSDSTGNASVTVHTVIVIP